MNQPFNFTILMLHSKSALAVQVAAGTVNVFFISANNGQQRLSYLYTSTDLILKGAR